VAGKVLGLGNRRDRNRPRAVREDTPRHVDALGGLHMRAQNHTQLPRVIRQPGDIALKTATVEEQRWRDQVVDRLWLRACLCCGLHAWRDPHH
jgi:hypothetical protein